MKTVIFIGPKKHGKSTSADMLVKAGYNRYSFADPLKEMLSKFLGIDLDDFYNQDIKDVALVGTSSEMNKKAEFLLNRDWINNPSAAILFKDLSDRIDGPQSLFEMLMFLYETFSSGKEYQKNYSLRVLMQETGTDVFRFFDYDFWVKIGKIYLKKMTSVVCDDCRFLNEIDALQSAGAESIIVKILNPRIKADESLEHSSENSLQVVEEDILILNDGSLGELNKKVLSLI